jgi:ABC-2 type transport system permease protein
VGNASRVDGLLSDRVVAQIAASGVPGNPMPPLSSGATQRTVVASAAGGDIFALVVGVILITTEFRHSTSRPTFLLEPRRGRVIAAKLVVAAGVGLLYGAACVAISVAIIVPWLTAKNITIGWVGNDLLLVMLGVLVVVATFAVVGVGVGVLFRNQVAAVISALAYLFVVEPLLAVIPGVKEVARYLPEASADASHSAGRIGQWRSRGLQCCLRTARNKESYVRKRLL